MPAPLLTIVGVVGVIIAYVQRGDARGSWVESHITWLIRTFWWSTVWAVIGWVVLIVFAIILIGFALGPLIWGATAIWVLYRVIRGILLFKDNQPIRACSAATRVNRGQRCISRTQFTIRDVVRAKYISDPD